MSPIARTGQAIRTSTFTMNFSAVGCCRSCTRKHCRNDERGPTPLGDMTQFDRHIDDLYSVYNLESALQNDRKKAMNFD